MKNFKSVLKNALLVGCVAGASVSASAATLTKGHVDIGVAYEDGGWDLHVHDEGRDQEYEPGDAILRVNPGAQTLVPVSPAFSFLGNAGDPVWILPNIQDPDLLFLGFGAEEIEPGMFVGDQVKMTLKGVVGLGHFAVYTTDPFGNPVVAMNSRDGISDVSDFHNIPAGGHGDMNWAFSAPGVYTVSFEGSGTLNDGEDTYTSSGSVEYTFLVIGDTTKPSVAITSPSNNLRTNSPVVTISGVARDNGKVKQVLLDFNGSGFQSLTLDSNTTLVSWSYEAQPTAGTNIVLIKAIDAAGIESVTQKRTFFFVVTEELSLLVSGSGSITSVSNLLGNPVDGAPLEIGRPYKVKAVPGADQVFSNWTGSVTSSSPILNFIMQSNMVLQANFIPNPFIPASGVYNGLFREEEIVLHDSAGFITLKVRTNFAYSGKIRLDGNAVSFSGKFNLDGTATREIVRTKFGKSPLTVNLALDFADETEQVTGTLASPEWTANIEADKATFNKVNLATNYMGNYTFLFPGFSDGSEGPAGYGYGLVKMMSNGVIRLNGALPDGIPAKQSVAISREGRWPLYVPLYISSEIINGKTIKFRKGSLIDWVTFSEDSLSGHLKWTKTGWTNGFYDAGFTLENDIAGSAYVPPAYGTRAVNIEEGQLTLDDGNLVATLNAAVFVRTNNTLIVSNNINSVTARLNPKTGLLSGTFIHPETSTKTKFSGAVLQSDNIAAGVFRGTNQTGAVLLQQQPE